MENGAKQTTHPTQLNSLWDLQLNSDLDQLSVSNCHRHTWYLLIFYWGGGGGGRHTLFACFAWITTNPCWGWEYGRCAWYILLQQQCPKIEDNNMHNSVVDGEVSNIKKWETLSPCLDLFLSTFNKWNLIIQLIIVFLHFVLFSHNSMQTSQNSSRNWTNYHAKR